MASQVDVNKFLCTFKKLAGQCGIKIALRQKNKKTLEELGFHLLDVQNEILTLESTDYLDGPKPDRDFPGDIWEFGKTIEHEDVYIKLKVSKSGQPVCISFHIAEQPIIYPFK